MVTILPLKSAIVSGLLFTNTLPSGILGTISSGRTSDSPGFGLRHLRGSERSMDLNIEVITLVALSLAPSPLEMFFVLINMLGLNVLPVSLSTTLGN